MYECTSRCIPAIDEVRFLKPHNKNKLEKRLFPEEKDRELLAMLAEGLRKTMEKNHLKKRWDFKGGKILDIELRTGS